MTNFALILLLFVGVIVPFTLLISFGRDGLRRREEDKVLVQN